MIKKHDLVDLNFDEVLAETEKAWLIVIGDEKHWLPKSQVEIDLEDRQVTLPKWLAEEKELM